MSADAEAPMPGDEDRAPSVTDPEKPKMAGALRQFVIFHVDGEMFALALSEVQEIIRLPEIVKVPLSPRSLQGLANLRGIVLPILSLRDAFNFRPVENDDATRVVVLDHGHPIGIVVDRMANVISVEADRIESADTIRATVDTEFLTGMIKAKDGRSMVMILDARQLVDREFRELAALPSETGSSGPAPERRSVKAVAKSGPAEEDQLVSFQVAGQEYAFPIERVQEIVQLPDTITHVPNVSSHVLGVIMLRNRLLPLVSLRAMFGLPVDVLSDANKVVVVSVEGEHGGSVGIVMDSVKEVLRVSRTLSEPVPALVSNGGGSDDIQAICRLEDGTRLVSVLSVQGLFKADDLPAIMAQGKESIRMDDETIDHQTIRAAGDEEQFVIFRLMKEEYGVAIGSVQEIVRVPEELTRIPRTPDFIEGVINLRGFVLPVIDQRKRFHLDRSERNDRQRIMVFTIQGVRTGFVVDSVSEVMRIPAGAIGAAPSLSGEQKRVIKRVANLEGQKRMILLLDVPELLNLDEAESLRAA